MSGLAGKHALVTGVIGEIGAAIARDLTALGARVTVTDQPSPAFDATVAALGMDGIAADLNQREQVGHLADAMTADPPLIIASAAGGVCGQVGQPVEQVTTEDRHRIFAANVDSAFHLAHFFAPAMKRAGWGRIVTISSGAGLRPV